ncbi:glycosyltransferase family 39 protein [Aegicerativicinus sediminis]
MVKQEYSILSVFCLIKFFLQYILIHPVYDLQRDEYLHLDQANHLAWGYESVPPVTSWISWVIKFLGNDVFWIKFFPALFGVLTIIVVWNTITILKGNLYAKVLGASCILFSILLRLNTLYQPNSLDVLCWTSTMYLLIRFIQTDKPKWIYFTALIFAFGFLNKYNILFIAMGLFPAILLTKTRFIFLKKELYLAALLAFVIVLPNLLWQYTNNFPVVGHMNELAERQLVNVERTLFLKNQLLFFLGGTFVIIAGLYALVKQKTFEKFRFFFWSFIFTLAIFTFFKAKDYYAIGLYPIYIAFGSSYLSKVLNNRLGNFLKPVLVLLPLLLFIPFYNVAFPNKSPEYIIEHQDRYQELGMLRWEDGEDHHLPQDFADMLGWKELAGKVDKAIELVDNPKGTLILCDNYGQAGAINYYSKKDLEAVSFNADYINWFNLEKEYSNLIRITDRRDRGQEFNKTSPYFERTLIFDSITNSYAREFGTVIFIFENSNVSINEHISAEIEEIKNR